MFAAGDEFTGRMLSPFPSSCLSFSPPRQHQDLWDFHCWSVHFGVAGVVGVASRHGNWDTEQPYKNEPAQMNVVYIQESVVSVPATKEFGSTVQMKLCPTRTLLTLKHVCACVCRCASVCWCLVCGGDLNGRIFAEVAKRNVLPKQFLQKWPQLQDKPRAWRKNTRLEREREW